jgi:hypothetical protein
MPQDQAIAYQLDLMIDALEGAGVYVRSKDVPGLHLIGKSLKAMKPTIEAAIKRLFRDNRKQEVNIIWLADIGEFEHVKNLPARLAIYPTSKAA